MSSNEPFPEDTPHKDDSETYNLSGPEIPPESKPESVPRKKKRKKDPFASSENPFDAEFERLKKVEQKRKKATETELEQESEKTAYGTKRTRIVDTTKRPSESLIASFLYPFYRDGIKMVFFYSFFIFVAQLTVGLPYVGPIIQPFALLLIGTFVGLMMLEAANDTLLHQGGGVQWPDLGLDSLVAGLGALAVLLIARIPVEVLNRVVLNPDPDKFDVVPALLMQWGAISLGLLYLPMSFIALAELESEKAFNPILVFGGIFKMFGSYVSIVGVALILFLGLNFLLINLNFPDSVPNLIRNSVPKFIRMIAFVYLSTVLIRAVGLSFSQHELSFESDQEEVK